MPDQPILLQTGRAPLGDYCGDYSRTVVIRMGSRFGAFRNTHLAIAALFGVLAVRMVCAQGAISFANNSLTRVTNLLTFEPVVAGTTFQAALYYLPDQLISPTTPDFDMFGSVLGAPIGFVIPGVFIGGTRTTPPSTPPGGIAWFQVRVWETAFGSTYEEALNNPNPMNGRLACVGTSNIIRVPAGDPSHPIGAPGTLVAAGLQGFYVCIPEPGTWALVGLGGAFLAWSLRRQRHSRHQ
jgi:hypothetical protein